MSSVPGLPLPIGPQFITPPIKVATDIGGDILGAVAGPLARIAIRLAVGTLGATLIVVGLVMIALETSLGKTAVNFVPGGAQVRKAIGK